MKKAPPSPPPKKSQNSDLLLSEPFLVVGQCLGVIM